jgi:1-acyl-sn-glycerol-3-phosphate acyltransferase
MTGSLLFKLLQTPAKWALPLYTKILVADTQRLKSLKGPLLLAVNHPNSFLDAIILSTLIKQPVHSLARGDAFKNRWANFILRQMNMLPVYRLREGAAHLHHNYSTFDLCRELFQRNGIVLIFSEGRCINEWKLRPLMKGTARLSFSSWEAGIPLTVLPIGINYDSFHRFGKTIEIKIGEPINATSFDSTEPNGNNILEFNRKLYHSLKSLVFESEDSGTIINYFQQYQKLTHKPIRCMISLGKLLHLPLYIPMKHLVKRSALLTEHYDSALVGLLFLSYPIYLMIWAILFWSLLGGCSFLIPFVTLPLFGRYVVKHSTH